MNHYLRLKTIVAFAAIFLFFPGLSRAQYNYVYNGDFQYGSHPQGISTIWRDELYACKTGWARASDIEGTSDYFTPLGGNNPRSVRVPINFFTIPSLRVYDHTFGIPSSGTTVQGRYAGILMTHFDSSGGGQGREYLRSKLKTPLAAGKRYKLSFFARQAYVPDKGTGPSHAIAKLGAYISTTPPLSNFGGPILPASLVPPNEILIESGSGGIPPLAHNLFDWQEVTGTFIANGNEEWITIGNFEPSLTNVWRQKGSTDYLLPYYDLWNATAYYYIDDVTLALDDSEPCDPCGYSVVSVKQLQDSQNRCCYEIKIKRDPGSCPITKIVLNPESVQNNNGYGTTFNDIPAEGEIKTYTFCYPAAPPKSVPEEPASLDDPFESYLYRHQMVFEFMDGNSLKCRILKDLPICRACNTESLLNSNYGLQPSIYIEKSSTDNEQCCWDIKVFNPLGCNIELGGIVLNNPQLLGSNAFITGRNGWNVITRDDGTKLFGKSTSSGVILPGSNPMEGSSGVTTIGRICLPNPTQPQILLNFSILLTANGSVSAKNWQLEFSCGVDCCSHIQINNLMQVESFEDYCCFNYTVTKDEIAGCRIRKVRITAIPQYGGEATLGPERTVQIVDPSPQYVSFPLSLRLCAPSGSIAGKFYLEFEDEMGVKCKKSVEYGCMFSPPISFPKHGVKEPNHNDTPELKIQPNAAKDQTTIHFAAKAGDNIRLELIDLLGNNNRIITSMLAEQELNSIIFDTSSLPSGTYFVRLIRNNQVFGSKLIIQR